MKKILFLVNALFFLQTVSAQTIPIVQAYNVIGTRDKAPFNLKYDIVDNKPKWKAYNEYEETNTTLYISATGNYLQIVEVDSTDVKTIVQCKIIQTKNGKTVIALNTTLITNEINKQNSIKFFEVDEFGGESLKSILPKMSALNFISKQDLAGQEDVFVNGQVLYLLNEKDNNINASAQFNVLEKECLEGSKSACTAKNVIQPATILKWNTGLKKYIKTIK
jgi:archaellum component FlaG (FlaF/FlaG flagellin family)